MREFFADIHMHPDGKREGNRRHGENPKRLADAIIESGLDAYALSEHHYVTEETAKTHRKVQGVMNGRKNKREMAGFDGVELTMNYKGLPYHIGYVFEECMENPEEENFPEWGTDIEGSFFQDWQANHPGVKIVNHPLICRRERDEEKRIELTTTMLAEGIVDGCEVLNGAILLNGKDGSAVRKTAGAVQAFLAARKQRKSIAPIASSDAHWAKYRMPNGSKGKGKLVIGPGCVRTRFTAESPAELLWYIREGRTQVVASEKTKIRNSVQSVLDKHPEFAKFLVDRNA